MRCVHSVQGKQRNSALCHCRLAAGRWSVSVGEGDRATIDGACAGQRGLLRRCDSVEHALVKVGFYGMFALHDPSLAGSRAARAGKVRAARGKPEAHHLSDSAVPALGADVAVDGSGVADSPSPEHGWGRLRGAL